jgi:hypothetical protein
MVVSSRSALLRSFLVGLLLAGTSVLCAQGQKTDDRPEIGVSHLRYNNDGGYVTRVRMKWVDGDGKVKETGFSYNDCRRIPSNYKRSEQNLVELGESTICAVDFEGDGGPDTGEEVWLMLHIRGGETKSCRLDQYKLKVAHQVVNRTAKFSSRGTTTLGNRCRFEGFDPKLPKAEDTE